MCIRDSVWSAAWEMTRQAEMRARDFVELVQRGIAAETEIGVVQRVLMQATTAIESYADPGWADRVGRPGFSSRLLELARGAEAGSDHQLAFVNTWLAGRLNDDQVDVARSLLNGTDPAEVGLDGLSVDTDLRWKLVRALATAGAIDPDPASTPTIDAEAERDNTATGTRQAAAARTARPLPEAKAAAWKQAIEDDTASNIFTRTMIEGFARPGQGELLEPYVAKYFEAVPEVWARRSSEVAQTVVVGLYPSWALTQRALDLADEFLAADHPPALKRLISEGRDGVARSMRAREFDARDQ